MIIITLIEKVVEQSELFEVIWREKLLVFENILESHHLSYVWLCFSETN